MTDNDDEEDTFTHDMRRLGEEGLRVALAFVAIMLGGAVTLLVMWWSA